MGGVVIFVDLLRGEDQIAENRAIFEQRIILRNYANHSGVDVAKNDLVVVRQADVVNLEKRVGIFASFGQALSSQMLKPLPLFQLQVRVGKEEFFRQAQRVVLKQANQQDCDLNRKDGL